MSEYADIEQDAIVEANKLDLDDVMTFGPHYFGCGWMKEEYFNSNYAVALALIGSLCGDKKSKNSHYHKGVAYIAAELGIPKRQVKIPRKKVKYKDGYWFKTPYTIAAIIKKMIDVLSVNEQDERMIPFLVQSQSLCDFWFLT